MGDFQMVPGPSAPENALLQQYIRQRTEQTDLAYQVEELQTEAGRGVSRLQAMSPRAERAEAKNTQSRRRLVSFRVLADPSAANYFGVVEGTVWLNGEEQTEDAGSAFDFYDTSFEVTAETFGWIDVDEVAGTWTMNVGAAVPAAAVGHQVQRLFRIAWDGVNSRVDDANCEEYYAGDVYFFTGESKGSHSFRFKQTTATGGTVQAGACYLDGTAKTITNLPASLSGVTASTKYWIEINLTSGAVDWKSGTGAYTAETATLLVRPILEITCADSVITGWVQRRCSDLHEYTSPLPAGTNNADLLSWDATSGAYVVSTMAGIADGDVAKYNAATKKWIKVTPVAVTVVTAVQYDNSTHQDQIKTRSITALAAGAESGWTLPTGGQLVIES